LLFSGGCSPVDISPVEESGCGGLFSLSSSAPLPTTLPPKASLSVADVELLVGSKHHFDLVKIGLNGGASDSTRILTLASGSSTGAISATEVL
jgi:hypothetical protein